MLTSFFQKGDDHFFKKILRRCIRGTTIKTAILPMLSRFGDLRWQSEKLRAMSYVMWLGIPHHMPVWHRKDLFTAQRFIGYNSKSTTIPRSSGGISLDGQISTSEPHEVVCRPRPKNRTDTKKGARKKYGNAHGVADMRTLQLIAETTTAGTSDGAVCDRRKLPSIRCISIMTTESSMLEFSAQQFTPSTTEIGGGHRSFRRTRSTP